MMFPEEMKYSEILRLNSEAGQKLTGEIYQVKVLSNIMVHQSKDIIEFLLRSNDIPAFIKLGGYDNIVQDSFNCGSDRAVIIFWELSNIVNGLYSSSELLSPVQINEIVDKTKNEIDLVLKNLAGTPLILFNRFSSIPFSYSSIIKTNLETISDRLNKYLDERKESNIQIIYTDKVIAALGIERSITLRYFYSSMTLYTIEFLKKYAEFICPIIFAACGKSKKALVFDCDNTLWNGVLGEAGFLGIDMSHNSPKGRIFNEIQRIALALNRQGVVLGLCSKNNPEEVDNVIQNHPEMLLRNENLSVKKVNWEDKVANLRAIADELNIGMDSIVYVDDSSFEVSFIKQSLPLICVIQVPENLHEYPALIRKYERCFFNLSVSSEDQRKSEIYKEQTRRDEARKNFDSLENYLASLDMKLTVYRNNMNYISRASQLTQKTNQFNLTTKRYTQTEISSFIGDENYDVFVAGVTDKFGDNGITAMWILKRDGQTAEVDTFLMSCRIIGRNIEYALMDYIFDYLKNTGIQEVKTKFIPTLKNKQVENFYENCLFELVAEEGGEKHYLVDIDKYKNFNLKYIEVTNA